MRLIIQVHLFTVHLLVTTNFPPAEGKTIFIETDQKSTLERGLRGVFVMGKSLIHQ
jgi:hypothetical protein